METDMDGATRRGLPTAEIKASGSSFSSSVSGSWVRHIPSGSTLVLAAPGRLPTTSFPLPSWSRVLGLWASVRCSVGALRTS